jgi:hypothetical protein
MESTISSWMRRFSSTVEDAREAQRRLLESGVLDRFADKHGPNVVTEAGSTGSSAGCLAALALRAA